MARLGLVLASAACALGFDVRLQRFDVPLQPVALAPRYHAPRMGLRKLLQETSAAATSFSRRTVARSSTAAALLAALLVSPEDPQLLGTVPTGVQPAIARELASGSGSKVNKDPNSLLRWALPSQPKEVRSLQSKLEETQDNLIRKDLGGATSASKKASEIAQKQQASILKAVPAASQEEGKTIFAAIIEEGNQLKDACEAKQLDQSTKTVESVLAKVSKLEELIATGYVQPMPPSEYKGLPMLKGRATVEFVVKRDGGKFDVLGTLYDELKFGMVIDGYNAPITGGNFVDLVNKGFYTGMHIQRSDGFVVQTGDPSKEDGTFKQKNVLHGFKDPETGKERRIPLEVYVRDDPTPLYAATFDEDGRGGYASSIPFNAYGALGMAREEYNYDSASSQWFWLLFDSDLIPAGKNMMDGSYSCFGYTIEGAELLADVKEGDIIASAKVTSGLEGLGVVA